MIGLAVTTVGVVLTSWALVQTNDHAYWTMPGVLVVLVGVALYARRPVPRRIYDQEQEG